MSSQDIVFIVTGESGLTAQIDMCQDRSVAGRLIRITSGLVLERDEIISFFIRVGDRKMTVVFSKSSWRLKVCFDDILYDYEYYTFYRLMRYLSYVRVSAQGDATEPTERQQN